MSSESTKIIGKKIVYDGFFKLLLCDIDTCTQDGARQTVQRLVLDRGHSVAVLPYDPMRDEVVLIDESARVGPLFNGDADPGLMLPAGMVDGSEIAWQAAAREAAEETALELKEIFRIHNGAYASPGSSSETIALAVGIVDAAQVGGVHGKAEEGEVIKPVVMSADEFVRRAKRGEIKDLKTIAVAFWLAAHKTMVRETCALPVQGPLPQYKGPNGAVEWD